MRCFLIPILFLTVTVAFAQNKSESSKITGTQAVTVGGEKVLLKSDGTWKYSKEAGSIVQKVEKNRVEINKAIKSFAESYGDVPPTYSCKKPRSAYDNIICANKDMQLVEKLYRMLRVYAYENATKLETNHKTHNSSGNGIIQRNKLKTPQAVLDHFIEQINDSLGKWSPFYADR